MTDRQLFPLTSLALASTSLHPDDVAAAVAREAASLGATEFVMYLVDLEQRLLVPLGSPGAEPLTVDGTVAGRAYRTEEVVVSPSSIDDAAGSGIRIWMPLRDSAERLGVIGLTIDDSVDTEQRSRLAAMANLTAELIANKADQGDVIAQTRRTKPLTIAAEMRWATTPPRTFKGRNLTISGVLEPAYEIAGDAFDYAVNGDTAHVAIIDAVGHGLESARIADLAVIGYRHSRRRNLDLGTTYWAMDALITEQFGAEKFATAQLAALDMADGRLCWLNAGHPAPMAIRHGRRMDLVSDIYLPVGLAGVHGGAEVELQTTDLEPGDVVLFFTDGVVEARSRGGEEFGRDRLADHLVRAVSAVQTPAETVRVLSHAVMAHQEGVLQDDATLLLLVWDGPGAPDAESQSEGETKR